MDITQDKARLAPARDRSIPVNAAWLSGPVRALHRRFDELEAPDAIADEAARLLADETWIAALLDPLLAPLRADPWFEPAFRVNRDPLRTGAVLFDADRVAIIATVISARALAAMPTPETVVLTGRHSVSRYVRGGNARLRRWRLDESDGQAATPLCIEQSPLKVHDGMILRQNGWCEGQFIARADRDVVMLTATVKTGAAPLMREYRIADGSLLRAASADEGASRMEMLLTLLRVAGRQDAADCFDAATYHPAFHLRWAAMREWLMLDAGSARARLVAMAQGDADAQVRSAAAATLNTLDRKLAACPA